MARGERKRAVAIACWWSRHNQPGFWLLNAAPGAEWPFRSLWARGAGAPPATLSAQLRGPTMDYLEKVRTQFLSLRQLQRNPLFSGELVGN